MTERTIRFNFEKARHQATELDNIADHLSRMAAFDYSETMQNISASWKGENAAAYLKKADIVQGDIISTVNSLHNIASDIRRVARKIYDAEMAALAIAQERTYN